MGWFDRERMDSPLRAMIERKASIAVASVAGCLLAPALLAAIWMAVKPVLQSSPWADLWQDPRTFDALTATLWTSIAASLLAWCSAAYLLRQAFIGGQSGRWLNRLPPLLATPHAAMAIAVTLWIAPTGWLFRLSSPWLTGFDSPPPWATTQDTWGIGLILVLWLKELPFLCWVAATQLHRDDVRRRWHAEYAVALTMGRSPQSAFAEVVWPQLARLMRWPLVAVLAYNMTVVDVALIIGPTAPPTLAVLAWEWLRDADLALNHQGVAAAWLLAALLIAISAVLWATVTRVVTGFPNRQAIGLGWVTLFLVYALAWLALFVGSVSGLWPFPDVWPDHWQANDWLRVTDNLDSVWTTVGLGTLSATLTLLWLVAWLECAPQNWQAVMRPVLLAPMVLPPLLWVFGLYQVALWGHWEGAWPGMVVAHAVMAMPYALLALESVYKASDRRLQSVALSLGRHPMTYLLVVKWPLLKRALWSAWAIAFAVSVAQFLPTLYIGAGRFVTVTTEAVAQSAAGQRGLMSAYALLQTVLPLLVFAIAVMMGRPRHFTKDQTWT